MNEIKKHHPSKMYSSGNSPNIPSAKCKQHLSVDELEQRTQANRVLRHKKMIDHKEVNV
jgi:hypothetical protein